MRKWCIAVGARPNFVKAAPLIKQIDRVAESESITYRVVHTGQHYDYNVSEVFFKDLEIPSPDTYLNVGSGSHAEQTAKVIVNFERELLANTPDLVIVFGDTNSTLGCALAARKLNIPIAHIEAGCRSYDMMIPEEVNRVLIDHISDYCFTPTCLDSRNLAKEGIPDSRIFFVGNILKDTIVEYQSKIQETKTWRASKAPFALLTCHRPDNTEELWFRKILHIVNEIGRDINVVFPVHPRMKNFPFEQYLNISTMPALGYLAFLKLLVSSRFVITDSGGVQCEAAMLGVPCITLREKTEWVDTVKAGVNFTTGLNEKYIWRLSHKFMTQTMRPCGFLLWDGNTARRIVSILMEEG